MRNETSSSAPTMIDPGSPQPEIRHPATGPRGGGDPPDAPPAPRPEIPPRPDTPEIPAKPSRDVPDPDRERAEHAGP